MKPWQKYNSKLLEGGWPSMSYFSMVEEEYPACDCSPTSKAIKQRSNVYDKGGEIHGWSSLLIQCLQCDELSHINRYDLLQKHNWKLYFSGDWLLEFSPDFYVKYPEEKARREKCLDEVYKCSKCSEWKWRQTEPGGYSKWMLRTIKTYVTRDCYYAACDDILIKNDLEEMKYALE